MVLLAVRMVADATETRNVIPSLGFTTCMTIKSLFFFLFEKQACFTVRQHNFIEKFPSAGSGVKTGEGTSEGIHHWAKDFGAQLHTIPNYTSR